MRNKAAKWVFEALEHVTAVLPLPVIGIASDNGSELEKLNEIWELGRVFTNYLRSQQDYSPSSGVRESHQETRRAGHTPPTCDLA